MITIWKIFSLILFTIIVWAQNQEYLYMSTCPESAGRACGYSNYTQYMLALKKNGGDVASTQDYQTYFFPCEQYTFDCGYMEQERDNITIANGIQLSMTQTQLNALNIADSTLKEKIKPYLGLSGSSTACAAKVFPLTLTSTQSQDFFKAYMQNLTNEVSTAYTAQKVSSSLTWANLNINIKTAVLQAKKNGIFSFQASSTNSFWEQFLSNNFTGMSSTLKQYYTENKVQTALHCAYLIDKVTEQCNKYQSVNFLVDESGSIGPPAFSLCLSFLQKYVDYSLDDSAIMTINFFDGAYEPYIGYGNDKATILSKIPLKSYRQGTTKTGIAINASVQLIKTQKFDNGVPKILVVMTDGGSSDDVVKASNYARQNDITLISIGIGTGVNKDQLLQIAGTPDNMLTISSYGDLDKIVEFIANYFCKQIKTINLGDTIVGNIVRVPTSPNYYRIVKSAYDQWYQLNITYQLPTSQTNQSAYQSQIDPFPNMYTQYEIPQAYILSETKKIYFIRPQNNVSLAKKLNLTQLTTVDTSYLALRGNNLKFNLSLRLCLTTNCSMERYRASIESNSCGQNCEDPLPTTDPTFFAVVSGVLVGLAACTFLGVLGVRKLLGDQSQEEMARNLPQASQQNDELSGSSQSGSSKSSKKSKSKKSKSKKSSSKNSEPNFEPC